MGPAVLETSDMDTMVDEPASDEVEEMPTELDTSDMDTMVDEPASDEVAVDPASAETAAETPAGEYNQGVDACIYASSPATLVETASAVPDFSTLVAALQAADLASAFDDMSQKVTVFAPTNAAFEKLFAAENVTAEEVLANKDFLTKVLKYHVAGSVLPLGSQSAWPVPMPRPCWAAPATPPSSKAMCGLA